ncbi:hypothetical protein LZ32DRAFT_310212 [Colletotrichum eremochloae]|nr:hypothetical protein LZ32DRAFT_310212 [Colletotrichum eremochloae]
MESRSQGDQGIAYSIFPDPTLLFQQEYLLRSVPGATLLHDVLINPFPNQETGTAAAMAGVGGVDPETYLSAIVILEGASFPSRSLLDLRTIALPFQNRRFVRRNQGARAPPHPPPTALPPPSLESTTQGLPVHRLRLFFSSDLVSNATKFPPSANTTMIGPG